MLHDLDRAVRLQRLRAEGGGVLVLVDADEDDPVELRGELLSAISEDQRSEARVVVAVKEYEAWFLAGIESLREHRSVKATAAYDGDPEEPANAKQRLSALMTEPYQETIHQVAFSSLLDIETARQRSQSLQIFVTEVEALSFGRRLGE